MSDERQVKAERTLTRKRRVEEIFDAALDVEPEGLSAFLDEACAGDHELRRVVEDLLEVERESTPGLLPSSKLAMVSVLADLHPSIQGLSLAPGMEVADRYKLLRLLGQGGMGTVFLAHDRRLRRRVAVKFLHAATQEMTARFLAEARTTARCKHENIVVIHDVDEMDGHPYMVLEHLEGEPLRQWLAGPAATNETAAATPAARHREAGAARLAMPVAEVLGLVVPMVRALVCAHEHGIVHRDLKPENVFLCKNGTVKVLDFGIAKALGEVSGVATTRGASSDALTAVSDRNEDTAQGALIGTLAYMSPEQWGADKIDERTDIWAVGIMLYEMLAGKHPLDPTSYSRLRQHVPDLDLPMPSIELAVPGLGKLAQIVDGCLHKRKAERVPSASALLQALEEVPTDSSTGTTEAMHEGAPAALQAHAKEQDIDPSASRQPAPDASARAASRPRSRRLALAGVGIGIAALVLFAFWPRLSMPAFPGTSGGIVLAVRAGAGDGPDRIHRGLCTALQERDAQAVHCVELPRFGVDHEELLEAASRAKASLIAALDGDDNLRLVPVGTAAELLSKLPTIHVAAAETQQHLPGILYPLSRALADDWRFDALQAPPVSPDAVGWRLAALAWYLNVLARNQRAIPPADVRSAMTRCRQEATLADPSCALVHYVFTQLDPTPPDAHHWLEELLTNGPPDFADPIIIELAGDDCLHEPARAEAALLRLTARWARAPCRRLTLIGAATCLLTRHPQASVDLQAAAYPGQDIMAQCEADLVAAAMTERGQWNMMAARWQQAVRDFDAAWKHGNHPVDLVNWAESLLHQRDSGLDVATPISAALDLRYFDHDEELRHVAAFLRWVATRDQTDAASLLRLYSDSPTHASVLVDHAHTLASLVCTRPEHVECQAYHILTQPKQPGSEDALRLVLVAGDER